MEVSSVGESGMADSLPGGSDDRVWPQSDPSFTEEAVEQGSQSSVPCSESCQISLRYGGQ